MRLMYDAVDASKIPVDAEMVAGYINGRYRWSQADWDRFPDAVKVRIVIYIPGLTLIDDGDVLDVEAKDAPNPEARSYARSWVEARVAAGIRPTIYTSKSGLRYFGHLSTLADFWIADPTDVPHLLSGTVATQYAFKGVYDISVVSNLWKPAPKGTVPMPAAPNAPCAGFTPTPTDKGYWLVGSDGGVFAYGDAKFFGSLGDKKLNAPIIGMKVTSTGEGYWLFAEDYGVFAFGDAEYLGHPGA